MSTINQQTRGPIANAERFPGSQAFLCHAHSIDEAKHAHILAEITHSRDARLYAASYTMLDAAARELGVDAVELAESIDLAEVIRYALDYSQLHSAKPGDVGRLGQTVEAARLLEPVARLMKARQS